MNLNIAENIKRLRIENNLTQAEFADCLAVSPIFTHEQVDLIDTNAHRLCFSNLLI